VDQIKKNVHILGETDKLHSRQISELDSNQKVLYLQVNGLTSAIREIRTDIAEIKNIFVQFIQSVNHLTWHVLSVGQMEVRAQNLLDSIYRLQTRMLIFREYARVVGTDHGNAAVLPPNDLKVMLQAIQDKIDGDSRLALPALASTDLHSYYAMLTFRTFVIDKNTLVIVVEVPLVDKNLDLELYKVHVLPIVHPVLKVRFVYQVESRYLAISRSLGHMTLPREEEVNVCTATDGHLCFFNSALYPIDKASYCLLALYLRQDEVVRKKCRILTTKFEMNEAVSLGDGMWAISMVEEQRMVLTCPDSTRWIEIHPPLDTFQVPPSCEATGAGIYIPAIRILSTFAKVVSKRRMILNFHDSYVEMTQYSNMIPLQDKFQKLTPNQLAVLSKQLEKDMPPRLHSALSEVMNTCINENYPYVMPTWLVYFIGISGVLLSFTIWTFVVGMWGLGKIRVYLVVQENRLLRSVSLLLTEAFSSTFQQLNEAKGNDFANYTPPDVSYKNIIAKFHVTPATVPADLRLAPKDNLKWVNDLSNPAAAQNLDRDYNRVKTQLEADYGLAPETDADSSSDSSTEDSDSNPSTVINIDTT
jgi:hypothetical protein